MKTTSGVRMAGFTSSSSRLASFFSSEDGNLSLMKTYSQMPLFVSPSPKQVFLFSDHVVFDDWSERGVSVKKGEEGDDRRRAEGSVSTGVQSALF